MKDFNTKEREGKGREERGGWGRRDVERKGGREGGMVALLFCADSIAAVLNGSRDPDPALLY